MRKDIIICDLDGTLALDDHRVHFLRDDPRNRKWDEYFAACGGDSPNEAVAVLLRVLKMKADYRIYLFSGRSEVVRSETVAWLGKYGIYYDELVMRGKDDRTQDDTLKIGWAESSGIKDRVLFVIEDRQRVVDAWRAAGYTCLQVAPGNF